MPTAKKPGTRIVNRGKGHSYLLDGEKVAGVTTTIKHGYPKPEFEYSAADKTARYAVDHWDELAELPVSEKMKRLTGARWEIVAAAGERGREVHTLGQRFLAGETIEPPDDLRGHFEAYVRFEQEWRPEELAVEAAVFSREYHYGGRFDLLARLADGLLWLVDFKTGAGVYIDSVLQLAAYRYAEFYVLDGEVDETGAAVEHPMPRIDRAGIVHLRGDGSYELVPLEAGPEAFAVFGAAQQTAEFRQYGDRGASDDWIGSALRPPTLPDEPELEHEEAAA